MTSTCGRCGCMVPEGGVDAHATICTQHPYHTHTETTNTTGTYTMTFILPPDNSRENRVRKVMEKAFELWKDRQTKYGPSNIAATGAMGCYVRSVDKLARLKGVYLHGKTDTPDETISDSWLDLINYAVMGYMCHHDDWEAE